MSSDTSSRAAAITPVVEATVAALAEPIAERISATDAAAAVKVSGCVIM